MLLLFVILVQVYQHVLCEEIRESMWVYEGAGSVLLPCRIPGGIGDIVFVIWSRQDLDPTTIQHFGAEDSVLNPYYSSRTLISSDFIGFFYRDFSLSLEKPRLFDSGTYTCIVHSRVHGVIRTDVELQVTKPNTLIISIWVLPVLLLLVVLVVCVPLGVADYLWRNSILISRVEVSDGECFVELPYKTFVLLPEGITVDWSRCTPEPMKVHVSQFASSHQIDQDQMYWGRTSMKKDLRKFGGLILTDLSLTLKDLCYRDSGTYICTVRREQEILAQKVVQLQVKVAQVEVETGDWSKTFVLPFVTTAQLPEDATVEWVRSGSIDMMVHVFENGTDQPYKQDECYHGKTRMNSDPLRCRDLSVTVVNSGYSDRGTYICTVRREGYIFAQRKVLLRVRGFTDVDVEVDQMAEAVKLPWFITANLPEQASVEWSRIEKKDISKQEDGQRKTRRQICPTTLFLFVCC
ncbi:uncharacterized protein LOC141806109 isoform X2 [Halichoeres trimaculatus]|uniref:uncharacterized protein LOC141806109 isoform X2 n=1 Tax=Halichoeres trimaculatus TaxID=147232 RepID=UPI003D9EC50F